MPDFDGWTEVQDRNPETYPTPFKRVEACVINYGFPDNLYHFFGEREQPGTITCPLRGVKYAMKDIVKWRYVELNRQ